jgi:hypothetical protein
MGMAIKKRFASLPIRYDPTSAHGRYYHKRGNPRDRTRMLSE